MRNDEDDEERKPSFGTSLERFRAGATSSPSRCSDRKRSRGNTLDDVIIKEEDGDRLELGTLSHTPVKKEEPSHALSSSNLESVQDNKQKDDSTSNTACPISPGSARKGKSPKKRKVYDGKQFEGMKGIPDRIDYDLDILFCGINPGVRSSQEGYHYAHPSNRFYRILYESGLTPHRLKPSESVDMPEKYKMGLTDLVLRCTARADQVPSMEFRAGATGLLAKIIEYRPKVVCFVGMDVYRQFRRHFAGVPGLLNTKKGQKSGAAAAGEGGSTSPSKSKGKQSTSDVQVGLQNLVISVLASDDEDKASKRREYVRLFVIPSTSGLAAGYSDADRINYLQDARQTVSAIRSDALSSQVLESDGAAVVVKAEEFLEDQIVKLASGKWSFVAKSASVHSDS